MNRNKTSHVALAILGAIALIMLVVVMLLPVLNRRLKIEIKKVSEVSGTESEIPGEPEKVLVTAIYEMKEDSKKIVSINIEVFHVGSSRVTYLELPADTKVNLSEGLYKSLQTYGPELPQYFKLSNMAESFSEGYGLVGCNRILSELLGITVENYVRAEAGMLRDWKELHTKELTAEKYFDGYRKWMAKTVSNRMTQERWMYYESRRAVKTIIEETAPGSREKDGYVLSGKQLKAYVQELLQPREIKE